MAFKQMLGLLLLYLWQTIPLLGQTPISGVINDYQSILEICGPSAIRLTDVSAYAPTDRIMIWQGTGAVIQTANSPSFGDITDTAQVGYYELNTICVISGDTLHLQYDLLNTYSAAAALQAIRVPVYQDAEVVGDLVAMPWDGQVGGVIALEVTGTLTMGANIDASGSGYRGGQYIRVSSGCSWNTSSPNYYYSSGTWEGIAKGEGIAEMTLNREWGRGPQGNGGGGGNDHNSGGGGGAHIGVGGQGGENQEPNFFGCDGLNPGLGGNVLSGNQQRLYFGGGGGAGHGNNTDPGSVSDGGNGGGIIYLQANSVQGNGYSLSAAGAHGGTASNDGGGGGGAGGSVLLDIASLSGSLTIQVSGGDGGDANNDGANRCYGPGGGGGGGALYSVHGLGGMTTQLAGGVAGQTVNTSASCSGSLGAGQGGPGSSLSGVTVQTSAAPAAGCTFLLALDQVDILINMDAKGYQISWTCAEMDWDAWRLHWRGGMSGTSPLLSGSARSYTIPVWPARYIQLEGRKLDGTTDHSEWIALPRAVDLACKYLPNPWPKSETWHNAFQVPLVITDMIGGIRWRSAEARVGLPDQLASGWYVAQIEGRCTKKIFVP